MLTASKLKRENIAEYLLYMWQIEDLIRANGLDMEKIKANIIDRHTGLSDTQRKELTDWYESLVDMMRREDVQQKGHLQLNENVMLDLTRLHNELMKDPKFADYNALFYKALPYIVEIRAKAGENKPAELEAAFNLLYGILLLKIQGKEISPQTLAAAQDVTKWLALLSSYYKKDYNNELHTEE